MKLQLLQAAATNEVFTWVYGALIILFVWNAWSSILLISLKEKAGKWEEVSKQLTAINAKLDLFLKQETDSLKEIAGKLIDRLNE